MIGTHGRTGLHQVLIGSVATDVLKRAKLPVVLYREPRTHPCTAARFQRAEAERIGVVIPSGRRATSPGLPLPPRLGRLASVSEDSVPRAIPLDRVRRVRSIVAAVGAIFLGLVFLVAGVAKVVDPESFAEIVKAEGLVFVVPAIGVAMLAIALEIGLGLALVWGPRSRAILWVSTALVLGFLFLTGRAYVDHLRGAAGSTHSCGCFGNLVDRSPSAAFWQDVSMLVPALALAWLAPGRSNGPRAIRRWIAAAVGTVGAVGFAIAAPSLPLDDFVTRLHVGDPVKQICTDALGKRICLADAVPPLAEGSHVVVLANLDDPGLRRELVEFNAYAADGVGPQLWVLVGADKAEIAKYCLTAGASCPVMNVPMALLRPLYRRLPRSFLVTDGRVEKVWNGLPPFRSLSTPAPR